MLYNRVFIIAIVLLTTLNSCFHKELNYSYEPSQGGVISGSSCFYLAQLREFQKPKGISTFPDGGMSRDVRQLFGLFKTDTLTSSTILVTRLGSVVGWPVRYSTRIEKNFYYIAIGIVNINFPDSINGIYLYSIKTGNLEKYSKEGALPSLTESGTLIAYCVKNRLVVDDCPTKTTLFSYLLNYEPVFVKWKNDKEILLFLSNPFRVNVLNISTGKTSETDLNYLKNYDQEIEITQINRILQPTSEKTKTLLDKYH
jgi:hypothetical protein